MLAVIAASRSKIATFYACTKLRPLQHPAYSAFELDWDLEFCENIPIDFEMMELLRLGSVI